VAVGEHRPVRALAQDLHAAHRERLVAWLKEQGRL